jgi:hypothetical protein
MSITGRKVGRLLKDCPVESGPARAGPRSHTEAQYLLYLARRAVDVDDEELVQELENQARDMADVVEARLRSDGLLE